MAAHGDSVEVFDLGRISPASPTFCQASTIAALENTVLTAPQNEKASTATGEPDTSRRVGRVGRVNTSPPLLLRLLIGRTHPNASQRFGKLSESLLACVALPSVAERRASLCKRPRLAARTPQRTQTRSNANVRMGLNCRVRRFGAAFGLSDRTSDRTILPSMCLALKF
ncbi:hypothetical protein ISCGN_013604 [Ixodes scapularis]